MSRDASSTQKKEDAYGKIFPLTRAIQARQARQKKDRICLHCNRPFPSKGPGHRFCSWCRTYLHMEEGEDEHLRRPRKVKVGHVSTLSRVVVAEVVFADGEGCSCLDDSTLLEVKELVELRVMQSSLGAEGGLPG